MPLPEAQDVFTRCLPLERHFHRYLITGGFPETALLDDTTAVQRILREDVVDKVLKRDMVALYRIRNILDLERLFIYLCLHSGQIVVQDAIAKEIGISRQTVANDLLCLELANLIYRSEPIDLEGKKALKPKPKIYLADAAIRNAVLLKGEEVLTDPIEMGTVVETAVFKHLFSFYYPARPRVGYWRDSKTEKEVDVVIVLPNGSHLLAEVKYRENPRLDDLGGLGLFLDKREVTSAFVVTKDTKDFGAMERPNHPPGKPKPFRIPAFAFLYLLGHAERSRWPA